MAEQLQFRRGTTAENSVFTGATGEVTYDTQKKLLITHDGATTGGFPMGGFLQDGLSAVVRTAESKLKESVSVKDFGAVGDGLADDYAAIQAALNSGAVVIEFPHGTYKITQPLSCVATNGLCIIGNGAKIDAVAIMDKILTVSVNTSIDSIEIRGLRIDGSGVCSAGIFVEATSGSTRSVIIENNLIENLDNGSFTRSTHGIRVDALGAETVLIDGNSINNVDRTMTSPGSVASVGIGVYELKYGLVISRNRISNITSPVGDADADGIQIFSHNRLLSEHQTAAPVITQNYFYNCKGRCVKLQSANAVVSQNRFEIEDYAVTGGFDFVDLQTGGGIVSDNTAFYKPAVGEGTSASFVTMNPRNYATQENQYVVSNNSLVIEGEMFAFAFSFPVGATNATIKVSDNIVSSDSSDFFVKDFMVLNLTEDTQFVDLSVNNNQINYLGTGSLFAFYQDCWDTISDPVTGPLIADIFKLSLVQNSCRVGDANIDLIETDLGPTTGEPPYLKHLMIRANSNFADSQVFAKGVDPQALPDGTQFYFSTDNTPSGGLVNAPVGFERYVMVERIGDSWCRLSYIDGSKVALFRFDGTPSGYSHTSTTALTF